MSRQTLELGIKGLGCYPATHVEPRREDDSWLHGRHRHTPCLCECLPTTDTHVNLLPAPRGRSILRDSHRVCDRIDHVAAARQFPTLGATSSPYCGPTGGPFERRRTNTHRRCKFCAGSQLQCASDFRRHQLPVVHQPRAEPSCSPVWYPRETVVPRIPQLALFAAPRAQQCVATPDALRGVAGLERCLTHRLYPRASGGRARPLHDWP